MLIRICLIVAIVAGLATTALNFAKIKGTIATLRENLASEINQKEEALGQLASTRRELDTTKKERDEARDTIASAQEERDKAIAEAQSQTKRANTLNSQLTETKQKLNDLETVQAQWAALGLKPEQIKGLQNDLKQSQADNVSLNEANDRLTLQARTLQNKLDKLLGGPERVVPLPPDLHGQILVADPKWDFVVLDVGEKQGVLEDGVLLVNRHGKLVAKVRISSVQANRCIANVLPDWKFGDVMEGDTVFP